MSNAAITTLRCCGGLGLAILLGACASVPAQPPGTATKEPGEEYVYRSSIGSRIPVRIKKSEAQTSREATERDQRWLAESQAGGVTPPSDPTAGR